tara:strand:+ start:242 stop:397 length:156 start_codon:yes stop_codon:yes gene_type:complete
LVNNQQSAGYKSIAWNGFDKSGLDMGPGMYIYVIEAGNFRQVKKMILLNKI